MVAHRFLIAGENPLVGKMCVEVEGGSSTGAGLN
jgi:hypothetical protein